ncbi:U-scoloptoxin(18)-Er1a-like [Amblyomma americanum]|uniref:Secreted protein n=1 Tax=Amblyomma americanum TaxID=6943 RepID=A0AAQ4DI49_AMBAM
MIKVVATVALLVVVVAAVSADEDIGQVPVLPLPKRSLELGAACLVSSECKSRCCATVFADGDQAGSPRQCRRYAESGERCSDEQIKGGTFIGGCPCRIGLCGDNGYCP